MGNENVSFSPFQIFTLCTVSSGLGTLCFAPFFGTGANAGWPYAILIAAVLSAVSTALYMHTAKSRSIGSFEELLQKTITAIPARILLFIGGVFFAVHSAVTAYITADAVGMYLLERTPRGIILLAVIFTACTVHDSGLKYTSRCCELLLMLTALPFAALLVLCLLNVDISEALVIFQPDFSSIIRLLPAALVSCSGSAAIVFSAAHRARSISGSAAGYFCSAIVSIILFICSAGIFTAEGTAVQKFPFIEMARSVSIGTISLTERFDTIFISVMFIAVISQMALLGGCACRCLSSAFSLRSQKCFTWILLPVIFALAYYAEHRQFLSLLLKMSVWGIGIIALSIIPALCILTALLKRKEA